MLIGDLGRSKIKNKVWHDVIPPLPADRATALERTLERVWRDRAGTRLFEKPFTALWEDRKRLAVPLLLLNTSDAVTGRRLVISPLKTGENTHERGDLLPLLGEDGLRLSTAVVLSARFPGVTPAGWIKSETAEQGYAIVDGGYADNSGARSAAEALAALREAIKAMDFQGKVQVVAIMIANDPISATPPSAVPAPGKRSGVSTIGSLIAPMMTLDQLRQTTTKGAKETYASSVSTAPGGLVLDQFDLREDETKFPLGWMLASSTRDHMKEQQNRMLADFASDLCRAIRFVKEANASEAARPKDTAPCNLAK
jgi:hypothetical protein